MEYQYNAINGVQEMGPHYKWYRLILAYLYRKYYRISSCISRKISMNFEIRIWGVDLYTRVQFQIDRHVQCDVYLAYRRDESGSIQFYSTSDVKIYKIMSITNWNQTRIGWFLFFFSQNLKSWDRKCVLCNTCTRGDDVMECRVGGIPSFLSSASQTDNSRGFQNSEIWSF